MVGYEPDLNAPSDQEKELHRFLKVARPYEKHSIISEVEGGIKDYAKLPRYVINETEDKRQYGHHLTTPLIQVCSVHVVPDVDDEKQCEIYGSILVLEGARHCFDLYDRGIEESETIKNQGTLSLISPDGVPILPSMSLLLCLKDMNHGVDIVKGVFNWNIGSEDSYDRLLHHDVKGPNGFARVYYVVFKFGFYGTVKVTLTKNDKDDKKCNATDLYGSVVTGYENGGMYCSSDQLDLLETYLFDKPSHQPLRVMVGRPVKLGRNVVAVPAYSSLTVKVNLWDSDGKIAGECLLFRCHLDMNAHQYIQTQFTCIEVKVQWHTFNYYFKNRTLCGELKGELSEEMLSASPFSYVCAFLFSFVSVYMHYAYNLSMILYVQILEDQHLSTSLVPRSITSTLSKSSYYGHIRAEVFSVFVSGITEKVFALCGSIIVDDSSDKFSLYNRDGSCPELLRGHGLASIEVNYRAIDNDDLLIHLNLKDPIRKLEVSKGTVGWHIGSLQAHKLLNKPVCSFVRGEDGFAAMHYEIFSNAFDALVEVKLFANGHPNITMKLYGTLVARYSGYDYSTIYQKKYYTSRLFDSQRYGPMPIKEGSRIRMLKSIVVVPSTSSLIIEANLGAFSFQSFHEPIRGMAEFKIDKSGTISKVIEGEHFWIEVCVKFE